MALLGVVAFNLRDIGKQLQHQIGNENAGDILVDDARVEQGHIDHDDIDRFPLRQRPPLLEDLVVIPSKPVDALDNHHVARLEPLAQLFVSGPVEIPAAHVIREHQRLLDGKLRQGVKLPVEVLIFC